MVAATIVVVVCLSLFGLLQQNTTDWVAYKQQKFISHSSGGWKSESRVLAWSGLGPLQVADFLLCPHMVEGGNSFIRSLIPFMRVPPSCPKHLPKVPHPNTIALGIRISAYEF